MSMDKNAKNATFVLRKLNISIKVFELKSNLTQAWNFTKIPNFEYNALEFRPFQ